MRETRKVITIYKFLIKDFERKQLLSKKFYKKSDKEKSECTNEFDYKLYFDKNEFLAQKYSIANTILFIYAIILDYQIIMINLNSKL